MSHKELAGCGCDFGFRFRHASPSGIGFGMPCRRAAPLRSHRLALPVAFLLAVLPAIAGCEAARGPASSADHDATKPSRDVDHQVDAVIKDFKNE